MLALLNNVTDKMFFPAMVDHFQPSTPYSSTEWLLNEWMNWLIELMVMWMMEI